MFYRAWEWNATEERIKILIDIHTLFSLELFKSNISCEKLEDLFPRISFRLMLWLAQDDVDLRK